jgi:transposase-like protein
MRIQVYKCLECGKEFDIETSGIFDGLCKYNLITEPVGDMSTHECDKAINGLGHLQYQYSKQGE